ncbi:hypothetical protein AX17_002013 [Amanita inopinata Kibby_2008]|nr:hypothetical protein AX17_002013 [Amanita inopinata Kibby_2008]
MEWYQSTLKELRRIDASLPIYMGDCWRPDQYADSIASMHQQKTGKGGLVALDHHLYRCFTSQDISTSASEHARRLTNPSDHTFLTFSRVAEKLGRAYGGLIVGEWSGALNPGSLRGEPEEAKRYVMAQLDLYEKTCAGWFFWTYKKQHRGDSGWCLIDAVQAGVFPSSVGLKVKKSLEGDEERRGQMRQSLMNDALASHTSHWSQYPGQYEHWRFERGFTEGWDEAYWFFQSSLTTGGGTVSELGFVGARAREKSGGDHKGNYWEYEHGFVQGVGAARRDLQETFG